MSYDIVDLFSGPRGWSEGLRMHGLRDVGLEWDRAACVTAHAAGHATVQCDVAAYPTAPFKGIKGKISSPPCQPWSRAGNRAGLADQALVQQAVHDLAHGRDTRAEHNAGCRDERSILAAEPMRWLYDLRPEWVCMEQVPDVLPLWLQYALHLQGWGYSTWVGVLNAADYGVPQTRKRAILIASRVRRVTAPDVTHAKSPELDLFGECLTPWVSMADALDLPSGVTVNTRGDRPKNAQGRAAGGNEFSADGPSNALTGRARSWKLRSGQTWKLPAGGVAHYERAISEPSFTILGSAISCTWVGDGVRERNLTLAEAAILQSFRADYPFRGTRTARFGQLGNAVPPLLAAHITSAALGLPMPEAVPPAASITRTAA